MEERRKKKQMQPSSSRRETLPENHRVHRKKDIGCMSGILQLLSRHHSRRRISSARKEKIETPPATSPPTLPQADITEIKTARTPANVDLEFSGDGDGLSRSPTLSSEIRRSGGGCFVREDSPRRPTTLLARLMGLEEPLPPPPQLLKPSPSAADFSSEPAEEKRRKLLGALERCDEDLRALKRIIDAVRTAEMIRVKGGRDSPIQELKCLDGNGEQPSPDSVLESFFSPKNEGAEKQGRSSAVEVNCHLPRRNPIEGNRRPPSDHKRTSKHHQTPADSSSAAAKSTGGDRWRWRWRRSNAMVESVGEVAEDAVCEERRELVRVGIDLADDVAGDLVDQLVMELVENCSKLCLQTLRCKRKLCF